MVKKNETKPSDLSDGTSIVIAGLVELSLVYLTATAIAPALPEGLKTTLKDKAHIDLDVSHDNLEKLVSQTVERFAKFDENQKQDGRQAQKNRTDKCKSDPQKTVQIGGYEFTFQSPNCW